MIFIDDSGLVALIKKEENARTSKEESTVSGGNATSPDESGTDAVSDDETDIDMSENTESVVLSDDAYLLDYIAATNTCLTFGVFLLVGLFLARMTWGRLK